MSGDEGTNADELHRLRMAPSSSDGSDDAATISVPSSDDAATISVPASSDAATISVPASSDAATISVPSSSDASTIALPLSQLETAGEDMTRTLLSKGIDPATLLVEHNGTIAATPPEMLTSDVPLPSLPPLISRADGEPTGHLRLKSQLGEGGMGVVMLADQLPLGREVAVKTLKETAQGNDVARALLREAYVLGGLEHPNILPVHMLGEERSGRPLMVMKRIQGTAWSQIIEGKEPVPSEGAVDSLEWHLNVLMQVCNAVHYAHSNGVLHRDVKPDNVMVGSYGEIYLVDWGIAVSLTEDGRFDLPVAKEVRTVSGTPEFMAPEMAAASGKRLGPATDVYLLGACLHSIITGEPLHQGSSLVNKLASCFLSAPREYGPEVPKGLTTIANRATDAKPEQRYQTAEDLRLALAGFLRRRHAAQLTKEALTRLDQLRELVRESSKDDVLGIYNLFGECRFAFRQALREWRENPEALDGMQLALETMAGLELDQGQERAAAALIAELPRPNPDLSRRMKELAQHRSDEVRRVAALEALSRDADVTLGMGARRILISLVGFLFGGAYVGLGMLARADIFRAEYGTVTIVAVVYGVYMLIFMKLQGDMLKVNQINRRFTLIMWLAFVSAIFFWPMAWWAGFPFDKALAFNQLQYFILSLCMGVSIEFRLAWAAVPLGVCSVLGVLAPQWGYEAMGIGVFGTMNMFGYLWRGGEDS